MAPRIYLILLLLVPVWLTAQPIRWSKIEENNTEKLLLANAPQPTKVLLVGAFHFNYPNLDAHKIDSSKMIDVLSLQRQQEIRQVVEVMKTFRPTRIYVEARRQAKLDSLYQAYLAGTYTLERDEIDQLAFRLAKELKLPKLYAVDATNFAEDHGKDYPWVDSLWNQALPVDSMEEKSWNARYAKLYSARDSLTLSMSILETLLTYAAPRNNQLMHGHYLSAGFNTTDDKGPDALSIWWVNRNLRIYNKILQTRPKPEDRIMVLFGAGHMSILRQCFESAPQFKLVELAEVTRQYQKK